MTVLLFYIWLTNQNGVFKNTIVYPSFWKSRKPLLSGLGFKNTIGNHSLLSRENLYHGLMVVVVDGWNHFSSFFSFIINWFIAHVELYIWRYITLCKTKFLCNLKFVQVVCRGTWIPNSPYESRQDFSTCFRGSNATFLKTLKWSLSDPSLLPPVKSNQKKGTFLKVLNAIVLIFFA